MPALYTITTRASGTILTAAIYNTDHQNHVNNGDAQHLGGFSANTSQMRTQTSPGDVGSESLSLSIADELARIRYMIALQRGTTFWYGTQASYNGGGAAGGTGNFLRNSNFLTAQRQGQANRSYTASAGGPYTFDQWYVSNTANQAFSVEFGGNMYPNDINSMAVRRTAGQTGVGAMQIAQPFTLAQLTPMLGQQITISISFQTGASWNNANVSLQLVVGTGLAMKTIGGFTGTTVPASVLQPTTPSMATTRIQATGVVPTNTSQAEYRLLWTPVGTAGANDYVGIAQAKLELGAQATPYIPPDPYIELQELSTFYWKSFPLGILPQQNAGVPGSVWFSQIVAAAGSQSGNSVRWPTRMIKPPTIVTYNPAVANTQMRNVSVNADCTATSVPFIDESNCMILYSNAAGSNAGNGNAIHLTADAGL